MGMGVAMNNTIPATPSNGMVNPANTNVNNIQLDDVQKLQQQLQDIKEQVKKRCICFRLIERDAKCIIRSYNSPIFLFSNF